MKSIIVATLFCSLGFFTFLEINTKQNNLSESKTIPAVKPDQTVLPAQENNTAKSLKVIEKEEKTAKTHVKRIQKSVDKNVNFTSKSHNYTKPLIEEDFSFNHEEMVIQDNYIYVEENLTDDQNIIPENTGEINDIRVLSASQEVLPEHYFFDKELDSFNIITIVDTGIITMNANSERQFYIVSISDSIATTYDTQPATTDTGMATENEVQAVNIQALFDEALNKNMEGNHLKAIDLYEKILSINPEHNEATYNLGLSLIEQNNIKEGCKLLNKSFKQGLNQAKDMLYQHCRW